MHLDLLEVLNPGLGATLQDRGRMGWRRFGVPSGGAMDEHAAAWANRLLENPADAPVVELLLQGSQFRVLTDGWIAATGADADANVPLWRPHRVRTGELIEFARNRAGVWNYIAAEGGFQGERFFGSVSAYPRAQMGQIFRAGDVLRRASASRFELPLGVAARWIATSERREYRKPPVLRVWRGPQWDLFSEAGRSTFFLSEWTVTGQSDRVGYRLAGVPLRSGVGEIISEPVRVGSIQVPENGLPLVTMQDGPTVGGYPKLGMVHPADLPWLVQCRPGQKVRFTEIDESLYPACPDRPEMVF